MIGLLAGVFLTSDLTCLDKLQPVPVTPTSSSPGQGPSTSFCPGRRLHGCREIVAIAPPPHALSPSLDQSPTIGASEMDCMFSAKIIAMEGLQWAGFWTAVYYTSLAPHLHSTSTELERSKQAQQRSLVMSALEHRYASGHPTPSLNRVVEHLMQACKSFPCCFIIPTTHSHHTSPPTRPCRSATPFPPNQ
jgi:hypothetical protein